MATRSDTSRRDKFLGKDIPPLDYRERVSDGTTRGNVRQVAPSASITFLKPLDPIEVIQIRVKDMI